MTPTPSPRRTNVSGRAAALKRPESPDEREIAGVFENRDVPAATVTDSEPVNEDPAVVNNLLVDIGGPNPVYPRQAGVRHVEDPLPMIPRSPKKYYNIYRGLKIGVFYDVWYVSKSFALKILYNLRIQG